MTQPSGNLTAGDLGQIVLRQAAAQPDAAAILGGQRTPLLYGRLARLVDEVGQTLQAAGVGAGDRVALALPNGPEAATSFLAVAAAATAAPLNPAYRRGEFDFYLVDLRAKILIVQAGVDSPAREAAYAAGVPTVELNPSPTTAGEFTLSEPCGPVAPSANESEGPCGDVALVLHTSGTTARPKIVPLTRSNLIVSAGNVVEWLQLTPSDRCLNVMPLFHIHGLVGALLSTITAGGSIVCETGFDASRALAALERFQPTWYTAVPTMHQAIVAAARNGGRPEHSLRFIRSCSSALPPTVMERLEQTFGVPVVEAYGMTEASHQMTCNPLPPRRRKPGSVGVPAGVGVAIMDAEDRLLPPGAEGEVVIRGANVTSGYEDNPQANFAAFACGWFRTGDQGRLDEDGYLFLTGRIKELINRGGEKISPREIDEALLTHPDVAQAMAFALPHATLGEDVVAAVVAKEGRTLDPADVRRHVAARLADFKTPQRIVVVPEIPKGPTGKPQRLGLAEKLGLAGGTAATESEPQPPSTETERRLAKYWGLVLEPKEFHRNDSFFACGGDSLSATMLLALIEQRFHVALPISALLESDGLADVAAAIDRLPRGSGLAARPDASLVAFHTTGNRPPLFMVHGHTGRAVWLGLIAPHLDADQPFYGFTARGMDGRHMPHRNLAAMASAYLAEVREVQPRGPYHLSGFCAGGLVAYEMAQQLLAAGERVAALLLVDTANPQHYAGPPRWLYAARTAKLVARRAWLRAALLASRAAPGRLGERIVNETIRRAIMHYAPLPYAGRLVVLRSDKHPRTSDSHLGWQGMAVGGVDVRRLPGDHTTLLSRERIGPAAHELQKLLDEAAEREAPRRRPARRAA